MLAKVLQLEIDHCYLFMSYGGQVDQVIPM